jgi:CDP-4-dehydro-6-deoxyglucose reductase, E3
MPTIKLNNDKQFIVGENESILDAAMSNSIMLEHSCRTGRCGICKAKVSSGETKAIKEECSLTDKDITRGLILTCCRTAVSDVGLDVNDLDQLSGMEVKTMPCRIVSLEHMTQDVLKVVLRLPPSSHFNYLAGQYIDVISKSGLRRSYSIANAPKGGEIELHIRKVHCGVMSKYWFSEAKVNDLLRFEGPLGTFFFRETSACNIVFIATGTGIAPVKSMIEDLITKPSLIAGKKIYIYWGARTIEDIYWEQEIKQTEVSLHPVLSRPNDSWRGLSGYVQQAVLDAQIPLENAVVYACGSSEMVQSSRQLFVVHGLNVNDFYADAFVSSN